MRKFVKNDLTDDNIKVLCTVPELYDDNDFDNIQKIRAEKLSFNKLTNIIYFVRAEDLIKINQAKVKNNIYLRLIMESPFESKNNLIERLENISTSTKQSLEESNSSNSVRSPMNDISCESPKSEIESIQSKKHEKRRSQRPSTKKSDEVACTYLNILPRIYNELLGETKNQELTVNDLFQKNISLLATEYLLYYFKFDSKYLIFVCQRRDEILFLRGTHEEYVSGAELNSYNNIKVKHKTNGITFSIFAPNLLIITFPIYILIENKNEGFNTEQFAKIFDSLMQTAIKQYKKIQIQDNMKKS